MYNFSDIFNSVLSSYGAEGLLLMAVLVAAFCVQMQRWCGIYGRIAGFRLVSRRKIRDEEPPVSVIVPIFGENIPYLDDTLPMLLSQKHKAEHEVVVVYVGNDDNYFTDLSRLRQIYPNLVATQIDFTPYYPVSAKMAINIGLKAAHYEHVIMTSSDAQPTSERWLATMSKGFLYGDVVIGYTAVERMRGISDLIFREWTLSESMAWLASAIKGRPFGATRHNLGFTKSLYYSVRGFNHLNLNAGEDDLFVQQIATAENVAPVCSAGAANIERRWGGWAWWTGRRHASGVTRQYYPAWARNIADVELLSRTVFFATAAAAIALLPSECKIAVAALVALRYAAVWFVMLRTARRLGERGLVGLHFIYDLTEPLLHACVRLSIRKKEDNAWR